MTLPTHYDCRRGIYRWSPLGNLLSDDCTVAAYLHLVMIHNLAAASSWQRLIYRLGYRVPHSPYAVQEYVDFLATIGEKAGVGVNPDQFLAWEKEKGRILEYQYVQLNGLAAPDLLDTLNQAMIDWNGCLITVALTNRAYDEGTLRGAWHLEPGDVPNQNLEHAVALVAYGPRMESVVTWGEMKDMTRPFTEATINGCWVFL